MAAEGIKPTLPGDLSICTFVSIQTSETTSDDDLESTLQNQKGTNTPKHTSSRQREKLFEFHLYHWVITITPCFLLCQRDFRCPQAPTHRASFISDTGGHLWVGDIMLAFDNFLPKFALRRASPKFEQGGAMPFISRAHPLLSRSFNVEQRAVVTSLRRVGGPFSSCAAEGGSRMTL